MSRFEIKVAGLGGQGIVLASVIIGSAALLYGGKNASQAQSYGPEARGGACKSEVVISDGEIDYPRVIQPEVLAIMSQEAYDKYVDEVKTGGIILYDPDMVTHVHHPEGVKVYPMPSTRMAEGLGRKIVANMVMVGAIAAVTDLDIDWIEKAIVKRVPRGTEDLNLKAARTGYNYIKRLLEEDQG